LLLLRFALGDWAAMGELERWLSSTALIAAGALAYATGLLLAGLRPRDLRER